MASDIGVEGVEGDATGVDSGGGPARRAAGVASDIGVYASVEGDATGVASEIGVEGDATGVASEIGVYASVEGVATGVEGVAT